MEKKLMWRLEMASMKRKTNSGILANIFRKTFFPYPGIPSTILILLK
jgi:hypothetical protein